MTYDIKCLCCLLDQCFFVREKLKSTSYLEARIYTSNGTCNIINKTNLQGMYCFNSSCLTNRKCKMTFFLPISPRACWWLRSSWTRWSSPTPSTTLQSCSAGPSCSSTSPIKKENRPDVQKVQVRSFGVLF